MRCPPKRHADTSLNGASLAILIGKYLEIFNCPDGILPSIGDDMDFIIGLQKGTIVDQIVNQYLQTFFTDAKFPPKWLDGKTPEKYITIWQSLAPPDFFSLDQTAALININTKV